MGRISTDLLGAYLDGDSAVSHELLHDALSGKASIASTACTHLISLNALFDSVLSTPAFKIKVIGSTAAAAPDDDDAVADVMAAASAKVVGALVKKHILQTVNYLDTSMPNFSRDANFLLSSTLAGSACSCCTQALTSGELSSFSTRQECDVLGIVGNFGQCRRSQ
jgi:hypothetical protein